MMFKAYKLHNNLIKQTEVDMNKLDLVLSGYLTFSSLSDYPPFPEFVFWTHQSSFLCKFSFFQIVFFF